MFGVSFSELLVILVVLMLFVGPDRIPTMLRQVGEGVGKLRKVTSDVRQSTGIDEALRAEGLEGGLADLRRVMRGDFSSIGRPAAIVVETTYEALQIDVSREYPPEGADSYGVLPDDLLPAPAASAATLPAATAPDPSAPAPVTAPSALPTTERSATLPELPATP